MTETARGSDSSKLYRCKCTPPTSTCRRSSGKWQTMVAENDPADTLHAVNRLFTVLMAMMYIKIYEAKFMTRLFLYAKKEKINSVDCLLVQGCEVKMNHILQSCLLSCTIFLMSSVESKCAYFYFPTLHERTLTFQENRNVSVPFKIIYEDYCQKEDNFTIKVSKITDITRTQCAIVHEKGSCFYPVQISSCVCLPTPEEGTYLLTHEVTRHDTGTWEWFTKHAQPATVQFNVLYPPRIKTLTFLNAVGNKIGEDFPAKERSNIHVICEWDDGNPPSTVHLMDRFESEIGNSRYHDGKFTHMISTVHCRDAGVFYCQAPGSTENKTATLLVMCAPEIGPKLLNLLTVVSGYEADLRFLMRAHTPDIQQCWLSHQSSEEINCTDCKVYDGKRRNCYSATTVGGSPPDLTVSVRLDNVRKQDQGTWRLTLTNRVGDGHLLFTLKVIGEENKDVTIFPIGTQTTESADDVQTESPHVGDVPNSSMAITVVSAIASVIIIVLVIILVNVMCVRRGLRRPLEAVVHAEMQPIVDVRGPGGNLRADGDSHSSTVSSHKTHDYEEVQDVSEQSDEAFPPAPTPCRRTHLEEEDEDYLHPVASHPDGAEADKSTDAGQDSEQATAGKLNAHSLGTADTGEERAGLSKQMNSARVTDGAVNTENPPTAELGVVSSRQSRAGMQGHCNEGKKTYATSD